MIPCVGLNYGGSGNSVPGAAGGSIVFKNARRRDVEIVRVDSRADAGGGCPANNAHGLHRWNFDPHGNRVSSRFKGIHDVQVAAGSVELEGFNASWIGGGVNGIGGSVVGIYRQPHVIGQVAE